MLPGIVEHLTNELDGVGDLMSPIQPLMTQAVTDDDHSDAYCTWDSYKVIHLQNMTLIKTPNTVCQACAEF